MVVHDLMGHCSPGRQLQQGLRDEVAMTNARPQVLGTSPSATDARRSQ